MRVLIAGIDGYLGWALARWLVEHGVAEVAGVDALLRREWVAEVGGRSVVPIVALPQRVASLEKIHGVTIPYWLGDLRDPELARNVVAAVQPDAIVHLAECPSAPYSMIDGDHARFVQVNNLVTTLNLMYAIAEHGLDCHLVKLGTMGEYGTPPVPIPEGYAVLSHRGHQARMPFPRQAGSWYHWSKVHSSQNLSLAARLWGLRVTDVMQGVVFGVYPDDTDDEIRATRLDVDAVFGTVVHRWCAQAVLGTPLTVYGGGGQSRGFIALEDSMRCLTLLLENRAARGEHRVVNQLDDVHRLEELAGEVIAVAGDMGIDATVQRLANPRVELEDHPYDVDCATLAGLGYRPRHDLHGDLRRLITTMGRHRGVLQELRHVLMPTVEWTHARNEVVADTRSAV